MRLRFTNSGQTHVLHDPRALPPRPPGAPLDLAGETTRGSLVAFTMHEEDHDEDPARIDVFVEEPVDPAIEGFAGPKNQGTLRVPSGRLILTSAAEAGEVAGASQPLTPGNYDVTWFAVDWGNEAGRAADAAAAAAGGGHGIALERVLTTATGVLICLTLMIFGYAACATVTSDVKFSDAWRTTRGWALGFGIAWAVLILFWFIAPTRKAAAARAQKQAEFPDFVVALRRTDDRLADRE